MNKELEMEIFSYEVMLGESFENFGSLQMGRISVKRPSRKFVDLHKGEIALPILLRAVEYSEKELDEILEKHFNNKEILSSLLMNQVLSEGLLEKHLHCFDLYSLSVYQKLSEGFIRKHYKNLDKSEIFTHQRVSEDYIKEFATTYDWDTITGMQVLSERFIEDNIKMLDWRFILYNQKINLKSVRKVIRGAHPTESNGHLRKALISQEVDMAFVDDNIHWMLKEEWLSLSMNDNITEDIIRKYHKELDWSYIVEIDSDVMKSLFADEKFLNDFGEKIQWPVASWTQILSEDVIRKYQDFVDWDEISERQLLSGEFILEFADKINHLEILLNKKIPYKEKIISYELLKLGNKF